MSQIREYEVTILISPDMEDQEVTQFIEKMTGTLTHGEGEAAKPVYHAWGKRQLAYEIKRHKDAYYLHFEANLDGTLIRSIERDMNYDENILRYLFVRKEEQKEKEKEKEVVVVEEAKEEQEDES